MRLSILPLLLGLVVTQVARSQERSPGEIATLKLGWNQEANFVALSPDGRLLASAGYSSDIRIWDVTTARRLYTLKGHSARAITFSPDGKLLASSAGSVVRLWDVQSGKQQGKLEIPIDSGIDLINFLAFRPDGKKLVGLYKVKTGDVVFAFKAHEGEVYSLAISRNGQTMASVSKDQTLKLWDLDP